MVDFPVRPISTSANPDFGQFLDVEFMGPEGWWGPKKEREKKKKKKTKIRSENSLGGAISVVRFCVKASQAGGRRRLHRNTAYAHLSGFNRPSCGASQAEGRRCSKVC